MLGGGRDGTDNATFSASVRVCCVQERCRRARGREEVSRFVMRIRECQKVVHACCQFVCVRERKKEYACMRLRAYSD